MKRIEIATVLALLFAGPALAQQKNTPLKSITMLRDYDVDSQTTTYCSSLGKPGVVTGGSSREDDYAPPLKIKTVGLDGTTVSDTASSGALASVQAGSIIAVNQINDECPFVGQPCRIERVVTSKASDDEVEVDPPWDLTGGYKYYFRNVICGTDTKSGEIYVGDLDNFDIWIEANQMSVDTGGIDVVIECRKAGGNYKIIEPQTLTTADRAGTSYLSRTYLSETYQFCRPGISVSDDDAVDTGADAEKVSIYFSGKKVLVDE